MSNWEKFVVERNRLPDHERENFTADIIDQIDDSEFVRILERNRAIYAEQYPSSPHAPQGEPQKEYSK